MVGDPARVDIAAESLDEVEEISHNREYRVVAGTYGGRPIGIASHGVGAAGAALCFEQLADAGATRLIRAGSAGGLQPDIEAGAVVIATGAVRDDGLTERLVPPSFPAVPDRRVVAALSQQAEHHGVHAVEGVVLTSDLFFPHVLGHQLEMWQRAGVVAVEMECAALFVIGTLRGISTGAVLAVDGNPLLVDDGSMEGYNPDQSAVRQAVDIALRLAIESAVADL